MAYSLSFSQEDGWFSVVCVGDISSFEEFSGKATKVVQKVVASGCKRILLDDRNLALKLDAHDIICIAQQLEKANLQSMGMRLASLSRLEDDEVYTNIETIYQNRSINFRRFDDKKAAVEWLRS